MSFAINNAVSLSQETAESLLKNLIVKTAPVTTLRESSFTSLNLNPKSFFDTLAEQPHDLDSLTSKTLLVFSHYGLLGKVVRNQPEITDKSAARLAEMLVILLGGSRQPKLTLNDLNLGEKALGRIFYSGVLNSKTYNNSAESKAYSKAAFVMVKELYLHKRLIFTQQLVSFLAKNNIQMIKVMETAHYESTETPFENAVFSFNCLNSTGQNSLIVAIRESLNETINTIAKGLAFVSVDSDLSRALGVKHSVDIVSWCHQLRVESPVFQLTALKACLDYQLATELSLRYWGDAICHLLNNESLYAKHNASELSKGVFTRYTPLTFSRILEGAQEHGCYALLKECLLIERSINQKATFTEPSPMIPFSNLSIDGDSSQQAIQSAYESYVRDMKPNFALNQRSNICHSLKDVGVVPNQHLFKITKEGFSSILYKLRETMNAPTAISCDEIVDASIPHRVSYMMDMVEYDSEGNLALTDIVSESGQVYPCESLVVNQSYCEALKGALRDGYLDLIFRETPFLCHTSKLFASKDLFSLFEEAIKQMIKRRSYVEDASQLYAALQLMFHFDLFDVDYLVDGVGVREFILNHSPLTLGNFSEALSACKESPYHQLSEVTLGHPISGVKPMLKSLSRGASAGVARSISDGSYERVVRLADMLNYVQSHGIEDIDTAHTGDFLPFFNLSLMAYIIRNKTPIEVFIDGIRGKPCFGESGQEPLTVIQGDSVVERSPILDEDFEALMRENHPNLVESGYEFKNPVLELFSSDNIKKANVSTVGIEELSKHIWESQKATVLKEGGSELSNYGIAKLNNNLLKQKFLELSDTIYVAGDADWKDLLCAIYGKLWIKTSGTKKYNDDTRGSIDAIGEDVLIDVVFVGIDQELAEPIVELGVKFDKHLLQWCFIYLFG
ncbi:hypothetical protein [Vibrio crassostreae]|uniref:hypothetical protein n=1 Tax=Vibrio crassostreae TaxID=246167 RepID=UPI001B306CD8|nr:hypothetical protein [Vibrio crassostreae]